MRGWLIILGVLVTAAAAQDAFELVADANTAYRNGEYDKAEKLYAEALAEEPNFPPAVNGLGLVAMSRGNYEEALDRLRPLISEYQSDPNFLANLGLIFKYLGDYGNAVEMFRQADALAPDNPTVIAGLAESLLQQGDTPEALPLTRRLISLEPNRADYQYLQGMSAMLNEQPSEARVALERSLELNPAFSLSFEPLFSVYYNQEDLPAAGELAESWCRTVPGDGSAWRAKGLVAVRRGDYPGAYDAVRKMLELARVDNQLIQAVSKWLKALDREEESLGLWRRVLELEPMNLPARAELGM